MEKYLQTNKHYQEYFYYLFYIFCLSLKTRWFLVSSFIHLDSSLPYKNERGNNIIERTLKVSYTLWYSIWSSITKDGTGFVNQWIRKSCFHKWNKDFYLKFSEGYQLYYTSDEGQRGSPLKCREEKKKNEIVYPKKSLRLS